ncbi:LysM peptidoglycan-binding domain-containing protein [Bacillaceae bacterium Marseille-Q3522]|nr:LysM peptidoglycan-binding domain-containing protein [Bacillaceae bacterium Marseille-Q3522]
MKGGGVLSQENQSSLRFSLEESVWFQKGQEVEELYTISLDPDISIQENELYVTIHGSLLLTGEYKRNQTEEVVENDDLPAAKFIHGVEEREGGNLEFFHRFPVDITIPLHRIYDPEAVEVIIESFDYVFPERSCLKLSADLLIDGLKNDESEAAHVQEEPEESEPDFERNELEDTEPVMEQQESQETEIEIEIELEGKIPADIIGESERKPASVSIAESEAEALTDSIVESENKATEKSEKKSESKAKTAGEKFQELEPLSRSGGHDRFKEDIQLAEQEVPAEEEEELYLPFELEARKKASTADHETPLIPFSPLPSFSGNKTMTEEHPVHIPEIAFAADHRGELEEESAYEQEKDNAAELEAEVESSSDYEEKTKKTKKKKKNSMSLTEFFARKDEETHSRLKVCIVQQGDTIDLLAERYDISATQLIRVNELDLNHDIYEGQVLYVPVQAAQK